MHKLKNLISKKKGRRLLFLSGCLFVVSAIIFYTVSPASAAISSVTTSTSSSTATVNANARKTWYDGSLHWAAIRNGTDIEFWYSASGSTWTKNSSATLSINTDNYSIEANNSNAYIAYVDTATTNLLARKATSYPGTAFSWGSPSTAMTTAGNGMLTPSINRGTNGYIWVMAYDVNGSTGGLYANKSTNTDDISSWGTQTFLEGGTTNGYVPTIVSLASGDVYAVYAHSTIGGTTLQGRKNTSGIWDSSATTIQTPTTGAKPSTTSNTSANEVYTAFTASGQLIFKRYIDGTGWQTSVTVDSNSGNDSPALMLNTTNSNLYLYWTRSNTVYMSSSSSPYTSWSGATTVYNTGTNANVNGPKSYNGSGTNYSIWTNGSANPYTVYTDLTIANSAPNTPSLSTPTPNNGNGRPTTTTPKLLMSATDPDSDTLKYKVYLYSTSANNGTNCTGSAVSGSPWDQNTSATGWDSTSGGSDPYSSGATAGFTVQTTLTLGSSYCFQAQAKDPSGSNSFGSLSLPSTFTLDSTPATPTLDTPSSGATQISSLPLFRLRTTDTDNDYLTYYIQIYDATACGGSQVGSDIDESSSHTGWQRENANSNQAYTGSSTIANSSMAIYQYSGTPLTANHLYSWRAKAKDPGGTNTYSSLTSCQDFTINTQELQIGGGTTIQGGTIIQ